jgi:hypothetical protein
MVECALVMVQSNDSKDGGGRAMPGAKAEAQRRGIVVYV